jgi:hypothetical protein
MRKWNAFATIGLVAVLSLVAGLALAADTGTAGKASKSVTGVKTKYTADLVSVGDTAWNDLPGARITFKVGAGKRSVFVARFSSAATCVGTNANKCYVQVLVDGNEASPDFDDASVLMTGLPPAPGPFGIVSGYVERSYGPVGGGRHVITIQYRNDPGTGFEFHGWNLTAERVSA